MLWALRNQADASQQAAVTLLRNRGATKIVQLWSINALAATASAGVIPRLASLPGVERISLDATLAAPGTQSAAAAPPEWNIDAVQAPAVWTAGFTGEGTVVAVMDTGVDANHADLSDRWRGGSNSWYDPNGEHATPTDRNGHGTQTTSIAVGGDAGGSAIGVAPGAQWVGVKIFNDAGFATLEGIHSGFQWLLDPDGDPATDDAPDVANNSWDYSDTLEKRCAEFAGDILALKSLGIAVVFSAGNTGMSGSVSPADNVNAFAVGAVDSSLNVAFSSSRGPSACDGTVYPEVAAPGVSVRAADLTYGGVFPTAYVNVSGTSAAAPHVAGAMALLRQAYPGASVDDLEQALTGGALDIGAVGPDNDSGYGLLDAAGALDVLASAPPPPAAAASAAHLYGWRRRRLLRGGQLRYVDRLR
jgi:bacillopeptidase F